MASTKKTRQRGSALVELSLCLLTFFLLTLGGMDYAWAVNAYNFCASAAQDAVRKASVHGNSPNTSAWSVEDVRSYVLSEMVGLSPSQLTVTTCWSGNCPTSGFPPSGYNTPGATVTVTVAYVIQPLSGMAIKQNLTVSSTGQYVISQ